MRISEEELYKKNEKRIGQAKTNIARFVIQCRMLHEHFYTTYDMCNEIFVRSKYMSLSTKSDDFLMYSLSGIETT